MVTPSSSLLFPNATEVRLALVVAGRVSIASAVHLTRVVNCLALRHAHSSSRPVAIASIAAYSTAVLCSWTCCFASDMTVRPPVHPPIVTCEVNGDAVPRPRTSGNRQTVQTYGTLVVTCIIIDNIYSIIIMYQKLWLCRLRTGLTEKDTTSMAQLAEMCSLQQMILLCSTRHGKSEL